MTCRHQHCPWGNPGSCWFFADIISPCKEPAPKFCHSCLSLHLFLLYQVRNNHKIYNPKQNKNAGKWIFCKYFWKNYLKNKYQGNSLWKTGKVHCKQYEYNSSKLPCKLHGFFGVGEVTLSQHIISSNMWFVSW